MAWHKLKNRVFSSFQGQIAVRGTRGADIEGDIALGFVGIEAGTCDKPFSKLLYFKYTTYIQYVSFNIGPQLGNFICHLTRCCAQNPSPCHNK